MSAPQIVMNGDTARARKSDPLASHAAADKSAATRGQVHEAVVQLITEYGPMNGLALNNMYREVHIFRGWPVVAFESPRKRAAELVGTRLYVVNPLDPRGTPAIYALGAEPQIPEYLQ